MADNNSSFLSSDRSSPGRFSSPMSLKNVDTDEVDAISLLEESMRSFIVSDSEDEQSCSSAYSPMVTSPIASLGRRKQPIRFAKVDLNTPRRSFFNQRAAPMDSLARVKEKVYKKETRGSKLTFDPNESADSLENKAFKSSSTASVISTVKTDAERKLLLELYPELANELQESPVKDEEKENQEYQSSAKVTPARGLSNTSPSSRCTPSSAATSDANGSISRNSALSEDGDESFSLYLEKLRTPAPVRSIKSTRRKTGDFIVDDDVIDESESATESSDEAEIIDEEAEEVSGSEDELSDEEYSEEEDNNESIIVLSDESSEEKKPSNVPAVKKLAAAFASPSVHRRPKQLDDDDHFLASLSPNYTEIRHKEAARFVEKGLKNARIRQELTEKLYEIYARRCFDNEISSEVVTVKWSARLRTTAGYCRFSYRVMPRRADVELSLKVCTTPDRLRDTMIHELCHAATWVIDGLVKVNHGARWQNWTTKCVKRLPSLPKIGVCHSYNIERKFIYECEGCQQRVGRHSKSLDVKKIICGICKGRFVLKQNGNSVGQEKRQPKGFALFVKEHYSSYKGNGMKHSEVMKILSAKWKTSKSKSKSTDDQNVAEIENDLSILSIENEEV